MKNQLLFSLSLLLVATSAFAEGNITLEGLTNVAETAATVVKPVLEATPGDVGNIALLPPATSGEVIAPVIKAATEGALGATVGDAETHVVPSLADKAKALWATHSTAAAQWAKAQKTALLGTTATAKDYAQAFWDAPRSVKKDIVAAAYENAKDYARNNKLNLSGSFIAAFGAYEVLSLVPFLNTEKNPPVIIGKKFKDTGFKKWAKVAAKLSASSALFAYLVSHQTPDKAAEWVKGLFPCKNNA